MIVRYAHDNDVVIHFNNKKGVTREIKLSDGTLATLTYPSTKKYFLRNGKTIIKKCDSFKTIEEEYVKEVAKKTPLGQGRIDIVKHKLIDNKVVAR